MLCKNFAATFFLVFFPLASSFFSLEKKCTGVCLKSLLPCGGGATRVVGGGWPAASCGLVAALLSASPNDGERQSLKLTTACSLKLSMHHSRYPVCQMHHLVIITLRTIRLSAVYRYITRSRSTSHQRVLRLSTCVLAQPEPESTFKRGKHC